MESLEVKESRNLTMGITVREISAKGY